MWRRFKLYLNGEILHAYRMGQWDAFNRVLARLNTYEDKLVDKHKIYDAVFDMRPTRGKNNK